MFNKSSLIKIFYIVSISSMVINIVNLISAIETRKCIMFFDAMFEKHKDELHGLYINRNSEGYESQMQKMIKNATVKMVVFNNSDAFWVHNHTFYHGKMNNGEIDENSISPVDVLNASKKDMNFLFNVLDDINE